MKNNTENNKTGKVEAIARKLMELKASERSNVLAMIQMYLAGKAAGVAEAEAKKSA